MSRSALVLFFAASVALLAQEHPAPPFSDATIRGRIVSAASGDPIRGAVVAMVVPRGAASVAAEPTLSDGDGRFVLAPEQPGRYTVAVNKAGYVAARLDVDAPHVLDVQLMKGAVIAGTITDELGEPVPNSGLALERLDPSAATRRVAFLSVATTDDLGRFRATGLAAGQYIVSVTPGSTFIVEDGRQIGTMTGGDVGPRVYYPGVSRLADAQPITLAGGQEQAGVTLTVPAPRGWSSIGGNGADAPMPIADPSTIAILRGRVTSTDGRALPGASVSLIVGDPGNPVLAVVTDRGGAFEMRLPSPRAGANYRLSANKPGYEPTPYRGTRRTGMETIAVAAGAARERLDISMRRLGTIAGRILDQNGDPVEGVAVRALQVRYAGGRRQLIDVAPGTRRTDDLGQYRLASLRGGSYAIRATIGQIVVTEASQNLPGYATTFFPGTSNSAELQLVTIGPGQELSDADFPLARARTFRVAGRAVSVDGDPVTGGIALIPSQRSRAFISTPAGARIGADGSFEFPGVAPGDYVVQVSRGRNLRSSEGEFVYRYVTVIDADVTGLQLQTSAGSSIAGRVTFEGVDATPTGEVELSPRPFDLDRSPQIGGPPARATAGEDGRFGFAGISGPRRLQVTRAPKGWGLKTILSNGADITDVLLPFGRANESLTDVEVILTRQMTRLSGRVTDVAGAGVRDRAVLVFAADRDRWYPDSRFLQRVLTTADGAFTIDGLPSGDYLVTSVESRSDEGVNDWQDPEQLDQLATRAVRVRLLEAERKSLNLRATP